MKKVIFLIIIAIIFFTGYQQYRVEKYILNQKTKYSILQERQRIKFLPYTIHFLSGAINDNRNRRIESKAFFMPYELANIISAHTNKDFDSYMVYCYFSKGEIEKYYKKNGIGSK